MRAVGGWKVDLTLPVGVQHMTLFIDRADSSFSGRVQSAMGDFDVAGEVDGDRLRWGMKAMKPVPVEMDFDVVVEGDLLTGSAKLGMLGEARVSGQRILGEGASTVTPAKEREAVGLVTGDSIDPKVNTHYVDVDEWRDLPMRHRYVRGGFVGTDARFSIYFPDAGAVWRAVLP